MMEGELKEETSSSCCLYLSALPHVAMKQDFSSSGSQDLDVCLPKEINTVNTALKSLEEQEGDVRRLLPSFCPGRIAQAPRRGDGGTAGAMRRHPAFKLLQLLSHRRNSPQPNGFCGPARPSRA